MPAPLPRPATGADDRMYKTLAFVAGATAIGFLFPSAFDRHQQQVAREQSVETVDAAPAVVEISTRPDAAAGLSGRARIDADPDGHFRTTSRMNGASVPVLVDTGAPYVSMSEATARELGIAPSPADYRATMRTPHGETAVALTRLGRLEIGGVTIENVEVMVARGDGLPTPLLGMSFLSRLTRFEVQSDRLDLVQ